MFWSSLVLMGGCMLAGFAEVARSERRLPGLSRDPFLLAARSLARGDNQAAAREYRMGAAINRYDYFVQIAAARGLALAKDAPGAEEAMGRAERLRPGEASTLTTRGWVLLHGGRVREAFQFFVLALQRDGSDTQALAGAGEALHANGQSAEAARLYARAVALAPRDASIREGLAVVLAESGRPGEAIEHFAAALELGPTDGRRANLERARAAAVAAEARP
jgi:tetratricopeptide (TPR) repeat protein